MIISFACAETYKIFNGEISRKFPREIHVRAATKLSFIHRAKSPDDLRNPPSNHLEKLSGKRKDMYSIRINDQFRICFRWIGFDAVDVEIIDYH